MDTENENFYEQSNLSSASSSNNSSNSNLLINLPMLPILHAHDDFDDDDEDDGQQPPQQQQHQSQLQSQIPADAMASHGGGAVSATSTFNNDTNTHTDATPSSVIAQINAPFLFNNHISPPLSSPSTASSSSSPPPSSMQMDSQSQPSSTPQSSSSSQEQQQHDQSSMHNPQQHDIAPPIATTQTQNNPTDTLFANETTEHLHQEHSPTPTFHQQHDSLQSTEHDDYQDDEDDGASQDQQAPPPHSLSTAAAGIVIETAAIAETIDVSAIEAPPLNSNSDGLVRIEDDDIELDEEPVPEQEDYDDEVFASSSQQLQQHNPLVLVASGASSSVGIVNSLPTSLPLLQTVPKHPNYASAGGYSTLHQNHQLLSSQASPQLPPSSLNSIFNFDRNGQPTMYGQGDGPHSSNSGGHPLQHQVPIIDRLKLLYPNVNELETPLPRCWSPHDKCLSIGLSQNNLRVHYKGAGKQHNDAASVRTAYPIPPACGLYYFEVKIISKGKNGYMGIGLTAQQFRMNRLPGWDKQSYGYHGDDGNSFSSSGNGQTYGPTFTTGDVIGCCVDFVKNTCFYTKNGTHLGIAFRDLPSKLYPTVGLQTPGEEVDANFGQEPFKFDRIEDMMRQMREEMRATIYDFPLCEHGDPTALLHKMVSSYLVHNGYSQTAESFAKSTDQDFVEDISSIRNRQKIIKLAMSGKMGQAIEQTLRSYPGLLENNKNLWFMLKCRQFIEMINGSDVEQCCAAFDGKSSNSNTTHTQITPPNQTSVIQSTKSYQNGSKHGTGNSTFVINNENQQEQQELKPTPALVDNGAIECISDNSGNSVSNNKSNDGESSSSIDYQNDIEMENNGHANGNTCKNGNANNFNSSLDIDEEMDVETTLSTRKYSDVIERILEFGKELSLMGQQLEKDNKLTDEERQMLEDAFSLIAYSNPWSSPLGWQLCPTRRETVCTALNSAILESLSYPRRPPLDVCVAHAAELLKVMAQTSLGACAFVNIEDVFPQN